MPLGTADLAPACLSCMLFYSALFTAFLAAQLFPFFQLIKGPLHLLLLPPGWLCPSCPTTAFSSFVSPLTSHVHETSFSRAP